MAAPSSFPARLSREERVGLIVAVAAHAGLFAWLALEPLGKPVLAPPERMTVSFAEDVAPQPTAPEPAAETAPEIGPELDEPLPLFEPIPPDEPLAQPIEPPLPPVAARLSSRAAAVPSRPVPKAAPSPRDTPRPKATPTPKATPRSKATPSPKATPRPKATARPKAAPSPKASPRGALAKAKAAPKAGARPKERADRRPDAAGGGRIGTDFLKGVPGAQGGGAVAGQPAAKAGPQVAAALSQAIARQLKPRWTAPQGAEADRLVTVLAWELNRDGSLAGRPRVVSQSGVTEANRAQQARHAEQAIRAVRLAAPFDLPAQYYDSWKRVSSFRFDRKLSQ